MGLIGCGLWDELHVCHVCSDHELPVTTSILQHHDVGSLAALLNCKSMYRCSRLFIRVSLRSHSLRKL